MALGTTTASVVEQFDYSDQDVNRGVQEFLSQMALGLEKDGTSMSESHLSLQYAAYFADQLKAKFRPM